MRLPIRVTALVAVAATVLVACGSAVAVRVARGALGVARTPAVAAGRHVLAARHGVAGDPAHQPVPDPAGRDDHGRRDVHHRRPPGRDVPGSDPAQPHRSPDQRCRAGEAPRGGPAPRAVVRPDRLHRGGRCAGWRHRPPRADARRPAGDPDRQPGGRDPVRDDAMRRAARDAGRVRRLLVVAPGPDVARGCRRPWGTVRRRPLRAPRRTAAAGRGIGAAADPRLAARRADRDVRHRRRQRHAAMRLRHRRRCRDAPAGPGGGDPGQPVGPGPDDERHVRGGCPAVRARRGSVRGGGGGGGRRRPRRPC